MTLAADNPRDDSAAPEGKAGGSPADAAERMRRAVAAAANGTGRREELEAAARELVQELRRADAPPEQMLARVKQILSDAGLKPTYLAVTGDAGSTGPEASIYRDVISWSIRYYYEEGRTPP